MRCENCGAELTGSEKFCIKCGMRLENQDVKSEFGNVDEIYNKEIKKQEIRGKNDEINRGVNVLGILSLIFTLTFWLGIIGVILAIIDLLKKDGKRKILSKISITVFGVVTAFVIIMMIVTMPSFGEKSNLDKESGQIYGIEDLNITGVTVDQMYDDVLDFDDAKKTYNNQYIELFGKIRNIDGEGDYFRVDRINTSTDEYVTCYISKEQFEIVKEISDEEIIYLSGTITSVDKISGYRLEVDQLISVLVDGELISVSDMINEEINNNLAQEEIIKDSEIEVSSEEKDIEEDLKNESESEGNDTSLSDTNNNEVLEIELPWYEIVTQEDYYREGELCQGFRVNTETEIEELTDDELILIYKEIKDGNDYKFYTIWFYGTKKDADGSGLAKAIIDEEEFRDEITVKRTDYLK